MARVLVAVDGADVEVTVKLNDSLTAQAVRAALPFTAKAQTWGAEVYFTVPVACGEEDPRATVELGAVGYWPPGNAVCLFFGQQPISPVNLIGTIEGDPGVLEAVHDGQSVTLSVLAE